MSIVVGHDFSETKASDQLINNSTYVVALLKKKNVGDTVLSFHKYVKICSFFGKTVSSHLVSECSILHVLFNCHFLNHDTNLHTNSFSLISQKVEMVLVVVYF